MPRAVHRIVVYSRVAAWVGRTDGLKGSEFVHKYQFVADEEISHPEAFHIYILLEHQTSLITG